MSDKVGKFCWSELVTADVDAAKKFYADSFGWKFTDHKMDNGTYLMITTGDKEFAGIWEIPPEKQDQIPPHWKTYILVDNLKQSLEKVQKNGASIKVHITKAGDFGQFAIIVDPTGAHVALWEPTRK